MEAHPLRTQEATEVAAVLYREVITRYGAPRTLVSDRGQTFMSKLTAAMCELFQITRHYCSSYHPQSNSHVERANSIILQAFRIYCKDKQDDWPEILPSVMMAHRMTPCTQSSQESPFFLLFGREMHLPIDTALLPKDNLAQDHKIHLNNVLRQLETTRKIATENIKAAQVKYKYQFDKRSQEPKFQPADRVWLYCTKVAPGKAPKLHRKWAGPYYITMLGPNHTYKVRNCATNKEVKSLINGVRLKPYYDPEDRPTNPPAGFENMEEELNAEEIADQVPQQVENRVWLEQNRVQLEQNRVQLEQNRAQEGAGTGNNREQQNQAQKGTNTGTNKNQVQKNVENRVQNREAQRRPITKQSKETVRTNENTKKCGAKKSQLQSKQDNVKQTNQENVHNENVRITTETQEKSKPYKGKGKKPLGKKDELHQRQSSWSQTGPREVRQSGSQPTRAPEPLPGGSHETDESVSHREKLDGQVRDEAVSHKMFSVESIDKLLSSRRSNGILYYRVKWKQPGSGSTWEYASSIPQVLIREFHASRTMSGKKRRRPLKGKHKFFERTENSGENQGTMSKGEKQEKNKPNQQESQNQGNEISENSVSSASTTVKSKENKQENMIANKKIVGVKIFNNKPYYIVQNQEPECLSVGMIHYEAMEFITKLAIRNKEILKEQDIQCIQNKGVPQPFEPVETCLTNRVYEIRMGKDGSYEFLMTWRKPELPPIWQSFDGLSNGSRYMLIEDLRDDYYKAIGKFKYKALNSIQS